MVWISNIIILEKLIITLDIGITNSKLVDILYF